jgi:prolipoprotein diacylglyceryltransferase
MVASTRLRRGRAGAGLRARLVRAWLGHHRRISPQGLFALYVAGYSGYRIFEETIRIDSSAHFLGLRLNFFIALVMTIIGLAWFVVVQIRGRDEPDRARSTSEGKLHAHQEHAEPRRYDG